jgi:hypothetical protein
MICWPDFINGESAMLRNSAQVKTIIWKWTLKYLRNMTDAVDEWVHAEEVKLRDSLATNHQPLAANASVDRRASAARERAIKKTRAARPRLRYQAGQFVR